MVIETFSQYFKVKSSNFTKLIYDLYMFNKTLITKKLQPDFSNGKHVKPKFVTVEDKKFFLVDEIDESIRYPIHTLDSFIEFLNTNNLYTDFDIINNKPNRFKKINIAFNKDITLRDYQESYEEAILKHTSNNILIDLQTGAGKAASKDTPVRTPYGWTNIGDLKIGDVVIGKNGKPTNVKGVYPQGKLPLYRITFADGRNVEVCLEHLWNVYSRNFTTNKKRFQTLTTQQIKDYLDDDKISDCYIDLPDPIETGYKRKSYNIDPYTLGNILSSNDIPNVNYKAELKIFGLYNKKDRYKSIPERYLNGDYETRLALLQGLMNIDGVVVKHNSIFYSTISEQLAKDIQLLIGSLGGICKIYNIKKKYTYRGRKLIGKQQYSLNIQIGIIDKIFTLPRKTYRYTLEQKLRIDSIEYIGDKEAVCIAVDAYDKLFIVKDYIVTHNTVIAMKAISELRQRFCIVILPRYIKKWIGDITELTDITNDEILVLQGTENILNVYKKDFDINKYRCVIISLTTTNFFIKTYLLNALPKGITPDNLFNKLKTSVILNDEAHQEFHNVARLMLFTNIQPLISMTATLINSNKTVEKMYELIYPFDNRVSNIIGYNRYINIYPVRFRFDNPKRIKWKTQFGYNQPRFEASILKHSVIKNRYFRMILDLTLASYLKRKEPGEKLMIFMGTVEMCSKMVAYLKENIPENTITKYTEEDDLSVIAEHDITVTTINSAGTAIDVKGLITVIQTVNIDSKSANAQTLGRLREIKGREVYFLYTWCNDIQPHRKYHYNRMSNLRKLSKSIKLIDYKHFI